MDETTHTRLIPCEKHAAIIGRQAALQAQRADDGLALRTELLWLLEALRRGDMGTCSHDFCVTGDDSAEQS